MFEFCLQLFYMVKGDMCLKVVEKGQHRDVVIKEGEVTTHIQRVIEQVVCWILHRFQH